MRLTLIQEVARFPAGLAKVFEVVPSEHKLVELDYRILKTPYTLNAHLYLVASFHRADP